MQYTFFLYSEPISVTRAVVEMNLHFTGNFPETLKSAEYLPHVRALCSAALRLGLSEGVLNVLAIDIKASCYLQVQ